MLNRHAGSRIPGRVLAFGALLAVSGAVALIVVHYSDSTAKPETLTPAVISAPHRHVPHYWVVRSGDSLTEVSLRTGLSVRRIEALNPGIKGQTLSLGQRLDLWKHT